MHGELFTIHETGYGGGAEVLLWNEEWEHLFIAATIGRNRNSTIFDHLEDLFIYGAILRCNRSPATEVVEDLLQSGFLDVVFGLVTSAVAGHIFTLDEGLEIDVWGDVVCRVIWIVMFAHAAADHVRFSPCPDVEVVVFESKTYRNGGDI